MTGAVLEPSLRAACERWPSRPAMTFRGRTLDYAEVWQRVLALAEAYRSAGITAGDRVVCQMPTCPEHLIAANAAWAVGAIHVGAHRDLTPAELGSLVRQTEASAVVVQPFPAVPDPVAAARAVREANPAAVVIVHGHEPPPGCLHLSALLGGPSPDPTPPVASGPEGTPDPALLVRTSGTTGEPKLVAETLPALWAKMAFFAEAVEPRPGDVHLLYLPIAHVFGLKLALMALATGGRLVLLDPFSPVEALRLVEDEGITITAGSPTHLALLIDELDTGGYRVDSLRWVVTAAASLPPALVPQVYERLGVDVLSVYGCSEGFLTRTSDRDEIQRGSVGSTVFSGSAGDLRAPPDGRVRVLDLEDLSPLPAGHVGEIAFGAAQPVRYWGQPPAATDGWYRTGDLGWMDDDGLVFVSGRLKEVVNRGGLKVAAGEIEVALAEHPHVADCAVVPAPDPVLGEAICACVVPTGAPPTLTDVREQLGRTLARHKLPDELCVVESIPRSSVGKVDRGALTRLVAAGERPRERLRARAADDATRSPSG